VKTDLRNVFVVDQYQRFSITPQVGSSTLQARLPNFSAIIVVGNTYALNQVYQRFGVCQETEPTETARNLLLQCGKRESNYTGMRAMAFQTNL
jgi:hypothetical protein